MSTLAVLIALHHEEIEFELSQAISSRFSGPDATFLNHFAEMEGPSAFERQGVFQFISLPVKVRSEIHRFAVIEPHLLKLTICPSDLNWFVGLYGVRKDWRMLGTCKEFCSMMKDVLYSENSFSLSITSDEPEEGTKFCQIDIRRIKKCHLFIDDLETDWSKEDVHDLEFIQECSDLNHFMETLVFKGG